LAIRNRTGQQRDVQTIDGTWVSLSITPFEGRKEGAEGAVISLHSVDYLKKPLEESRAYWATLIESARESIVILDEGLQFSKPILRFPDYSSLPAHLV